MKRILTVEVGYFKKRSKLPHYAFSINDLANIFDIHPKTMKKWIKQNKLIPTDLLSIIKLYNQEHSITHCEVE